MRYFAYLILSIACSVVLAAVPKSPIGIQELSGAGALVGGQSRAYLSLVDLRAQASASLGIDRLVFDFGDNQFSGLKGAPGAYHVEYREELNQVIITFHQALHWKFENYQVKEKLKKAFLIRSTQMEFDRLGQATVLTINLKKPIQLRVKEIPGERMAARLMIDLVDPTKAKK